MENGKLKYTLPSLIQIRDRASENLSKLHRQYKALTNAATYPVELSKKLEELTETLKLQIIKNEVNNGKT